MGKNKDKYRYFEIGISWESWVLEQMEQDATLHQMEDQLAKLLAIRLTEYYRLVSMGVIIPGITALQPAPSVLESASVPPHPLRQQQAPGQPRTAARKPREELPEEEEVAISKVEESEDVGSNAASAVDFFLSDEEENEE